MDAGVASQNLLALKFNEEIAEKVEQISKPLSEYFGITHFGYVRIFKDGKMLRIANNKQWTKTYFERGYYNDQDLYVLSEAAEEEERLSLLSGSPSTDHCKALCYEFNIWNALIIYKKVKEFSDFWFFATSPDNIKIFDLYLNKLALLKKFTVYFKEKFAEELQQDDPQRLIISNLKFGEGLSSEREKIKSFFQEIPTNKYILGEDLVITRKEFECLFYLVQGKTMKEIARLMNLSHRTIEFHLANVKNRTQAHTKSQLINKVLENKVFRSFLV